jgi:hypothetical protein
MGAAFGSCLLCIALSALLYMSVIYVYHYLCLYVSIAVCQWH